ncbi:TIGR03745 family integrating conjugative element membrane protein [Motilimonas eburnea]|uniref:TIGR03745 family integrating conjugative element membrane protein n=1 Tax=Motilimonas eburnea TaxID=1737488 RepID=UPI001E4798DE|nr:TIGR03745 family integrating conjugative element membrane protein [Motilimonas eburnea]MCE2573843.1 TIGR03745 family integrating conjugative element membrane protein [Motilimonas eburnea]
MFSKFKAKTSTVLKAASASTVLFAYDSYAALVAANDVTGQVKGYLKETVALVLLALCAVGFIVTVKNCVGAYSEIQDGKGTWGGLGMHVIVGGLILTVALYLLNQANGIFA